MAHFDTTPLAYKHIVMFSISIMQPQQELQQKQ